MKSQLRLKTLAAAVIACGALLLPYPAAAKAKTLEDQLLAASIAYDTKPSAQKLDKVKALIAKGAKVHFALSPTQKTQNISPLNLALFARNYTLVQIFLEQKPDLNIPVYDEVLEQPLLYAMKHSDADKPSADDNKIVAALLAAGPNVNAFDHDGALSPLLFASGNMQPFPARVDWQEALLKAGALPNQQNNEGNTALMSTSAGNLQALQLLLNAGVDAKLKNRNGATAMHYVCERDFALTGKPDPDAEARIRLLQKAGADINGMASPDADIPLGPPLMAAMINKNPDCVKALLKLGADPDGQAYANPAHSVEWKHDKVPLTVREEVLSDTIGMYPAELVKLLRR
ncbi:ankyrin repeat domain-containing protein [Chromobacterium vaccinii]|nr:ankyrin repeat domain-containing protein [Chromobacterium vaccinii]MBX9357152.1 ankyrin repeat domain-containing protein [Chromobacterium vaccinii]